MTQHIVDKTCSFNGSPRIRLLDSDLSSNPVCSHGSTLLFEDINNNKRYYSCSSCRNTKDCPFYMSAEEWLRIQSSDELKAKYMKSSSALTLDSKQKYFYDKSIRRLNENVIRFCRNCSLIISSEEQMCGHENHEIISEITRNLLRNPTKLLNSLTDNKFCAQYLFANQTKKFVVNDIIKKNGFQYVVTIGCPTIHEYIECRKIKLKIKSILLDIDERHKQFYSSKKYLKYNLFNNFFFNGLKDEKTFNNFIEKSPKESIVVLIDPPFGGLIEAMAKTIDKISEIWRKCNQIEDKSQTIPLLLFFPYFNEKRITTTIPSLRMSDFMVDYKNHNKFRSNGSGRKFGSPVRIFTNIELSSIVLPKSDGYYYCDYCIKYVSKNNKHCFACDDCTARDGKPYNHCYDCNKCVKQTWSHCKGCRSCHLNQGSCPKRKSDSNCHKIMSKKVKKMMS